MLASFLNSSTCAITNAMAARYPDVSLYLFFSPKYKKDITVYYGSAVFKIGFLNLASVFILLSNTLRNASL
jgi:hypothetical protein